VHARDSGGWLVTHHPLPPDGPRLHGRCPAPRHPQGEEEDAEEPDGPPAAAAAAERAASGANASTSGGEGSGGAEPEPAAKRPKLSKLGKDPTVRTDFLPDKDREVMEEELRQKLKRVGGAAEGRVGRLLTSANPRPGAVRAARILRHQGALLEA
jgi:hypothetical protein